MSGKMGLYRCVGVFALAVALLPGSVNAQKLTLVDCVTIALQSNPAVQIAKENINRSNSTIQQALSQGLPKVTLNGSYQRVDQVNTASFGGNTIQLGSLDNRAAGLVVSQPIDIFGIVPVGTKVARYTRTASDYALEQATNDITLQAKTAYYNVLRSQGLVKVQEETVSQLDAHLKDTVSRQQAGDATQFEILRARTAVETAKQMLLAAQNGVQLAKASFNNVLVRQLDAPVDLVEPDAPKFYLIDMKQCLDCATQNRPEVQQAEMAVKINDGVAKVTRLAGLPRINVNWNYNRNFDTSLFNSRENSWNAYLTASANLFDGGANKSAVEIAKSDALNSKSMLKIITEAVNLETKQAYLDVTNNRQRIQAAQTAFDTAKESMRLADVRYKGGVSTLIEVLDAQQALSVASVGYVTSLYDYQDSVARLEKATGGPEPFMQMIKNPVAPTTITTVAATK